MDLLGTRWVVPSGAVLAIVGWLSSLPERSVLLAPLGAGLIIGLVFLQAVEAADSDPVRGAAHATNIGAGFALAFGAYILATSIPMLAAVPVAFLVSAAVALVVLRGEEELRSEGLTYAVVIALGIAELTSILYGARVSPLLFSAVLVLALYATSGICHAILDRASRHAYIEVAAVTLVSLSAVVIAGGRA